MGLTPGAVETSEQSRVRRGWNSQHFLPSPEPEREHRVELGAALRAAREVLKEVGLTGGVELAVDVLVEQDLGVKGMTHGLTNALVGKVRLDAVPANVVVGVRPVFIVLEGAVFEGRVILAFEHLGAVLRGAQARKVQLTRA